MLQFGEPRTAFDATTKNALASFSISLARRSSLTSPSSSFTRCASAVVTPLRPPWISSCLSHFLSGNSEAQRPTVPFQPVQREDVVADLGVADQVRAASVQQVHDGRQRCAQLVPPGLGRRAEKGSRCDHASTSTKVACTDRKLLSSVGPEMSHASRRPRAELPSAHGTMSCGSSATTSARARSVSCGCAAKNASIQRAPAALRPGIAVYQRPSAESGPSRRPASSTTRAELEAA